MNVRALVLASFVVASCAGNAQLIRDAENRYTEDTRVAARLLAPFTMEPPHGQVSLAIHRKFAEKLLLSAMEPNVLTLLVDEPGRVYRQEVKKLGFSFDNDLAQLLDLDQSLAKKFFDDCSVHLLVLVREGVRLGVELNDDVLLAGVRVAAEHDGHFGHEVGSP